MTKDELEKAFLSAFEKMRSKGLQNQNIRIVSFMEYKVLEQLVSEGFEVYQCLPVGRKAIERYFELKNEL